MNFGILLLEWNVTCIRDPTMRPNCHISERVKGCCDICGNWPNHLHMPEEVHGWYCAHCCPVCNAQPAAQPQPENEPREAEKDTAPQAA